MTHNVHPEPQENISSSVPSFWIRRLLPAGFLLFIGWVIYLADTGQSDVFPLSLAVFTHTDKVGHVVLYGLLATLLGYGARFRTLSLRGAQWDQGAFFATLFACLEEVSQYLSPHRTPDAIDLLCSFLGIWLARRLLSVVLSNRSPADRSANFD